MDQTRFSAVCEEEILRLRERSGIGTLGEKTLHAVLKNYFEPDSSRHEIKVGNYIADIAREHEIVEIQTRGFHTLSPKLSTFLVENFVTIVYPIIKEKQIFWLDPITMAVESTRKSNKNGTIFDLLPELYRIRSFLSNPNLRICVTEVNVIEYRLLDGYGKDRKNHATKLDLVPSALLDEIYFETPNDYLRFLSDTLPENFSSADYRAMMKISSHTATAALGVLHTLGLIEQNGKKGRAFIYQLKNSLIVHENGIHLT